MLYFVKAWYQISSGQGVAALSGAKIEENERTEGLRVSTLCAELQFDTFLLMRCPFGLCSMWFLGAVLIAPNFLLEVPWLANPIVKYLRCPPSSSGELLQVWCLVAFILEKLLELTRVEIFWRRSSLLWKVKVQWNVCLIYLELILNWYAVRSWDLWRRRVAGTTVLLCYFYNC